MNYCLIITKCSASNSNRSPWPSLSHCSTCHSDCHFRCWRSRPSWDDCWTAASIRRCSVNLRRSGCGCCRSLCRSGSSSRQRPRQWTKPRWKSRYSIENRCWRLVDYCFRWFDLCQSRCCSKRCCWTWASGTDRHWRDRQRSVAGWAWRVVCRWATETARLSTETSCSWDSRCRLCRSLDLCSDSWQKSKRKLIHIRSQILMNQVFV